MYLFLCMINFQSDCIEKVEQVVRIKQKQEEDKASVKLHSFELVLLSFMWLFHFVYKIWFHVSYLCLVAGSMKLSINQLEQKGWGPLGLQVLPERLPEILLLLLHMRSFGPIWNTLLMYSTFRRVKAISYSLSYLCLLSLWL